MKTWLIRFSVLVLTLGLRGLRTAWIGLAGCADAESAYSKPGGASPIIQCRRGDLNPHGTRYRQILSLLRMPISPLRLLESTF